jgi:hypothetical protein
MKLFLRLFLSTLLLFVIGANYYTGDTGGTGSSPTIIDSYAESNYTPQDYEIYSGGQIARGQSFEGDGTDADYAKFYIKKTGSPTGSAYAKIWASTGTHGTNAEPTGSAVATSSAFDVSTLTTDMALVEFTFPTPYTTVNTTKYILTLTYNGGDVSNNVVMGFDDSSPTHGGNRCYSTDESTWGVNTNADTIFYIGGS